MYGNKQRRLSWRDEQLLLVDSPFRRITVKIMHVTPAYICLARLASTLARTYTRPPVHPAAGIIPGCNASLGERLRRPRP